MVRTQLQLDDITYDAIRARAHQEHKSMSAIVREILHEHLSGRCHPTQPIPKKLSFIGAGSSGLTDVSVRHDDYLAEDFR